MVSEKIKKNLQKLPFLTTRSPWRSARTAIMGNIMENGYVEKISLKKHFLMEF
jgi:hypothetical protein